MHFMYVTVFLCIVCCCLLLLNYDWNPIFFLNLVDSKLSSDSLSRNSFIQAMKIFSGEPEIEEIVHTHGFSFAQISPLLCLFFVLFCFVLLFFSFLVEFYQDRCNEWIGILCLAHSVLLSTAPQQHMGEFCNDFDTHYHMLAYILLRNKCSFTETTPEAISSHSPLLLGRKHGKRQFYKLLKFIQN